MARNQQSPKHRFTFRAPDASSVLTSLWADVKDNDDGTITLTLEREYEDFTPAPGWIVKGRKYCLEVLSVSGAQLTCKKYFPLCEAPSEGN